MTIKGMIKYVVVFRTIVDDNHDMLKAYSNFKNIWILLVTSKSEIWVEVQE